MRPAWRRAAFPLALAVLAALPAVAPAQVLQTVTPAGRLADGPLLAGKRVAWEETRCVASGGCGFEADTRYRIRAAAAGRVRTLSRGRIRSLPGGSNAFFSSVSFELSPSRFVLARSEFGTSGEQDFAAERLFAGGRNGGALVRLFRCRAERQTVTSAYALSGDRVAYDPNPCDEQARIVVRDLAAGSSSVIDLGGGTLADIALAGGNVAVVHGALVRLHDSTSGVERFSAPLPAGTLHGLDVSRDGRLAVSVGSERLAGRSCWPSRLWLLTPGAAALEQQSGRPCWDARLVRGGVAYLSGERRPLRLTFESFAGARRTVVVFGARRARDNFDAQGARGAFAVGCSGRVRIRVVSLAERAPAC